MRSVVKKREETHTRPSATGVVVRLATARAEPSDAELVQATLDGDASAKELLFRRHAPMVFGLAHRVLGGQRDDIDDLAQDAFLQAFVGLSSLTDGQSFAKWIGTIVIRTARRRIKRKSLRRRLGLASTPIDLDQMVGPATPPDIAAELRAIYALLQQLPVDERIALVLRRVEGLTLPEIAERMEISLATVKRRIRAAEVLLESKLRHP